MPTKIEQRKIDFIVLLWTGLTWFQLIALVRIMPMTRSTTLQVQGWEDSKIWWPGYVGSAHHSSMVEVSLYYHTGHRSQQLVRRTCIFLVIGAFCYKWIVISHLILMWTVLIYFLCLSGSQTYHSFFLSLISQFTFLHSFPYNNIRGRFDFYKYFLFTMIHFFNLWPFQLADQSK